MKVSSPRTCWKYVGTRSSPPKKAAAKRNIVSAATVKLRLVKRLRSSSGCSGLKDHQAKAAMRAMPTSAGARTFVARMVPVSGIELTP